MNAIFAVNSVGGFGTGTDMPWPRSPVDLRRFKELTTGHTVVMGSGTWRSNMPKPLPGRRNIVISKTLDDDRCDVYPSVTDMMMNTLASENIFVIGGSKVLWTFRPFITKVYLTRFHSSEECSVVLHTGDYLEGFKLVNGEKFDDHHFEVWEK
jgi:dihydrofolate reductase